MGLVDGGKFCDESCSDGGCEVSEQRKLEHADVPSLSAAFLDRIRKAMSVFERQGPDRHAKWLIVGLEEQYELARAAGRFESMNGEYGLQSIYGLGILRYAVKSHFEVL